MASLSDYLENAWLDHLLGTASYTPPSNVYIQLHTGAPGETGAANVAATSTRVIIGFDAPSGLAIASTSEVDMGTAAADETLTDFTIWDALTAGNCLVIGTMADVVATTGDPLTFAAGDVTVTCSGAFTTFSAQEMLDHTFRGNAYTMPTGQFVKLHLGDPGLAATGNPAAETTRVDAGAFSAASAGTADNDAAIQWTSVAATEDVSHSSLWDASTAGNALLQGALTTTKSLVAGQDAEFAAGALDYSMQ